MPGLTKYYLQFFTAAIRAWKPLLWENKYKEIILSSLQFLVQNNRIAFYGQVIMSNHIHPVWRIGQGYTREGMKWDFLKYTARQIKWDLTNHNPAGLELFRVHAKDRKFQVWERKPLQEKWRVRTTGRLPLVLCPLLSYGCRAAGGGEPLQGLEG